MEVWARHARTRAIAPDAVLPVKRDDSRLRVRREASRVSFQMCPFCVRRLLSCLATADAIFARSSAYLFQGCVPQSMNRAFCEWISLRTRLEPILACHPTPEPNDARELEPWPKSTSVSPATTMLWLSQTRYGATQHERCLRPGPQAYASAAVLHGAFSLRHQPSIAGHGPKPSSIVMWPAPRMTSCRRSSAPV
jgi:hypothetical protein